MTAQRIADIALTVESAAAGVPPPQAVRNAPATLDTTDLATLVSSIEGDGVIDLRDIVFFAAFIAAWLYACALIVDARKAD